MTAGGHALTLTVAHNAYLYTNEGKESVSPLADPEKLADVLAIVRGSKRAFDPKGIVERRFLDGIQAFKSNPRRQVVPCAALASSVSVDAVGDVHPCLMWGERLGNLRDHGYDLGRILELDAARSARLQVEAEQCPNCWTPCEAYQSIIGQVLKPF